MKKIKIILLISLLTMFALVTTVSAGSMVFPWQGSNVCRNPNDPMITFEDGTDFLAITNQYSGALFSIPAGGSNWIYGDVTSGNWNYPAYWCNGDFWALIDCKDPEVNTGRIDFTTPQNYVSVLVTNQGGVIMEAYDSHGTLIDQTNACPGTVGTGTMCQLTVEGTDIDHVSIHDSNCGWVIDDLCYGSSVMPSPEFPSAFLPATMIIGFLGAVLLIQRTREH
jgi:hypothetical protein